MTIESECCLSDGQAPCGPYCDLEHEFERMRSKLDNLLTVEEIERTIRIEFIEAAHARKSRLAAERVHNLLQARAQLLAKGR